MINDDKLFIVFTYSNFDLNVGIIKLIIFIVLTWLLPIYHEIDLIVLNSSHTTLYIIRLVLFCFFKPYFIFFNNFIAFTDIYKVYVSNKRDLMLKQQSTIKDSYCKNYTNIIETQIWKNILPSVNI